MNNILLALTVVSMVSSQAVDWPGMLGPRGDLKSGDEIEIDIRLSGPKVSWKASVGSGFSGPVVSDGKVYIHHRMGPREVIDAYWLKTGEKAWSSGWDATYSDDYGKGDGPRATPLVSGNLMFVHSPDGVLRALDKESGTVRWKLDLSKTLESKKPFFGFGASPAVVGGMLILNAGGPEAGVVGIIPATGQVAWKRTAHPASYSTAIDIGGGGAAVFTRNGVVLIDASDGNILFDRRWCSRMEASVNAASPVFFDNRVIVTSSYGTGCLCLKRDGGKWTDSWSGDDILSCHFSTPLVSNGLLVGFHGRQEEGTELRAVEINSGKVLWKKPGMGAGWLGTTGNKLLALREDGSLSLLQPSTSGPGELGSWPLMTGPCWSPCAIAGGNLIARDSRELKVIRLGETKAKR
jgi:outer membrane protein assembly factor BamB